MKSDTLLIRHLSPNLSEKEKREFLQHFGVIQLKTLAGKVKKSNVVFARFESAAAASIALRRLHQLDVLGYPLTVEFARGSFASPSDKIVDPEPTSTAAKSEEDEQQKLYEAFLSRLNSWHAPVEFCQPPPPTLKYQYPPPSRQVLVNITRSLAAVPKFYTQVLHLMNRMHLPSPFEDCQPDYVPEVCREECEEQNEELAMDEGSEEEEEESEMESDTEGRRPSEVIPTKRSKLQAKRPLKRRKFVKREKSSGAIVHRLPPEQVFEVVAPGEPTSRRIELRLPAAAGGGGSRGGEEAVAGGFGLMFPPCEEGAGGEEEPEEEDLTKGSVITEEQLAANRIPERDRKHLSVFKNHQPGVPSCRLYIKNLSKHVTERDVHFIYRRYLLPDYVSDDQPSMFDIRLMQEGRMKGQAFVTLQNVKQAQQALAETNGYILKDKPLVVQFARSAKAK